MPTSILLPVDRHGFGKQTAMFAGMLIPPGTSPTRRAEGPGGGWTRESPEGWVGPPLGLKTEADDISNPKQNHSEIFYTLAFL